MNCRQRQTSITSGLFLQIAIVIASVAILSRQHLLWYASLGLALFGTVKYFFL
jgi:hypothetical protein